MAGKRGRPSKYGLPTNETNIDKFLDGIKLGLSEEVCADRIGIAVSTINNWKQSHPEFMESIKKARSEGIAVYANLLLNSAKNAAKRGQATPMIYFLKTRGGEEWREKNPDIDANTAELRRLFSVFAPQMVSAAGAGRATPGHNEVPE